MSIVSFLFLVGGLAAVWWLISFGPAYWDNVSIKGDLHEAGNLCMKEADDEKIRAFLLNRLTNSYHGVSVSPEDVRIDRQPRVSVAIDVTYRRTVKPLFTDERTVVFNRHVDQDISPVKW